MKLSPTAMRYLVIGGGVYVFELVVIVIAQALGANAPLAVAIGYVLGTSLSFILQKFVTFGDKRTHHKILIPQIIATLVLVLWNMGFSVALAAILNGIVPAVITRTVALAITTIWNFYIYKTRIFKNDDIEPLG